MKNRLIIGIILILFVAAITNPSKEKYIAYVKETSIQQKNNIVERGVYSFFISPVMNLSTTSHDYIFFTIFETDIGEAIKYKAIGMFNKFILIGNEKQDIKNNSVYKL
ncbi:DUF4359 domain-containing protein [Clostridium lundense]|uniref:DUF4359 domain-containing protein n=1 Tax=Clostridium lundense TaxID=319475 RepID=UPI000485FDD9|nr:DUF4359 domain-containing protein [Clostridium lundense]